jgi:hypothetical protein
MKNPIELISFSVVFMNYWVGPACLHNSSDAADIRSGADSLLRLATVAAETSNERRSKRVDICQIEGLNVEKT